MLKIHNSGLFNSKYRSLIKNDKAMQSLILERIFLFRKNLDDTRLHNHPLKKSMEGKWSFSITNDIRIVYEWIGKTTVRFLMIGPHKDVYH